MPSASCFFEYFKNLDTENSNESNDIFGDDFCIEDDNKILNSDILEQEILQYVWSFKNRKAAWDDKIINAYIKTTVHIFMRIYLKLELMFMKHYAPNRCLYIKVAKLRTGVGSAEMSHLQNRCLKISGKM